MRPIIQKHNYIRSKAITNSAKDEACTICDKNDGTTVFCHLNESWAGKGKGIKADDIAGFYGCKFCHDMYDGRFGKINVQGFTANQIMRAMYRTWKRLIAKGIITIKP